MRKSPIIRLLLGLSIVLVLHNCENESKTPVETTTKTELKVPSFDGTAAYANVEKQVSFGPRVPGSEAHQACKDWLVEKLKEFGATVIEQDFIANVYTGEKLNATNIIGQYNPTARKRVVLAAHWDSRHIADSKLSTERQDEPILGADDGASGVGVLLEVARQLGGYPNWDWGRYRSIRCGRLWGQ